MEKNTASEGRKLNMEEKRKLEKLLLEDIDRAATTYREVRQSKRKALESDAVRKPPKEVRELFDTNERARGDMERTERSLTALGFRIEGYGSGRHLGVGYGSAIPKFLRSFDEETEKTKGALQGLKRTYTLKLFAGGEEAQGLFASLVKELVSIVS